MPLNKKTLFLHALFIIFFKIFYPSILFAENYTCKRSGCIIRGNKEYNYIVIFPEDDLDSSLKILNDEADTTFVSAEGLIIGSPLYSYTSDAYVGVGNNVKLSLEKLSLFSRSIFNNNGVTNVKSLYVDSKYPPSGDSNIVNNSKLFISEKLKNTNGIINNDGEIKGKLIENAGTINNKSTISISEKLANSITGVIKNDGKIEGKSIENAGTINNKSTISISEKLTNTGELFNGNHIKSEVIDNNGDLLNKKHSTLIATNINNQANKTITNDGNITSDRMENSGTIINNSHLNTKDLINFGSILNSNEIKAGSLRLQSGEIINVSKINIDNDIVNHSSFENNGYINAGALINKSSFVNKHNINLYRGFLNSGTIANSGNLSTSDLINTANRSIINNTGFITARYLINQKGTINNEANAVINANKFESSSQVNNKSTMNFDSATFSSGSFNNSGLLTSKYIKTDSNSIINNNAVNSALNIIGFSTIIVDKFVNSATVNNHGDIIAKNLQHYGTKTFYNYKDLSSQIIDNYGKIENTGKIISDHFENLGTLENKTNGYIALKSLVNKSSNIINSASFVSDSIINNSNINNNVNGIIKSNMLENTGNIVNAGKYYVNGSVSNDGKINNTGILEIAGGINTGSSSNIINDKIITANKLDNKGSVTLNTNSESIFNIINNHKTISNDGVLKSVDITNNSNSSITNKEHGIITANKLDNKGSVTLDDNSKSIFTLLHNTSNIDNKGNLKVLDGITNAGGG